MKTEKPEKPSAQPPRGSRRRFAKAVVTALVAAPLAAAARSSDETHAQTPPSTREATAPPNPKPAPTPATAAQQPKPSPLAEAYADAARVRFGDKLSPEELERVRRDLEGNVRTAERLRAVKLKNGDEPDFTFIA